MVQNGISINLLADVREAVRGADNVADAMDQIADVLKDISREGDRSTDRMERDFKGVQREVDDTADAIKAKMRDAYRSVERSSDDAGDAAKRDFGKMGDNVSSFRDEAVQNFSEVASSFTGDLDDMADGVQGLTGGLASALTPGIGIPLAVLGAAAGAWYQAWKDNQEKVNAEIEEWVDAFIEGSGKIDEQRILSGVQEYLTDTEKLAEAQKLATATGLDQITVLRALNGDLTDGKAVREALTAATDDLREKAERARDGEASLNAEVLKTNGELGDAADIWKTHTGALGDAADRFDTYNSAASIGAIRTAEAAVQAGKATKKVDEFGDAVYKLPDGKKLYVDAETGKATEDLETFKEIDIDRTATIKVKVDDSAWKKWKPGPKVGNVRVPGKASGSVQGNARGTRNWQLG